MPLACFWQIMPLMGMLKMDVDVVITGVWLTVRGELVLLRGALRLGLAVCPFWL